MKDLSLVEALEGIFRLVMEKIRFAGIVPEHVVLALVDTVMNTAIEILQMGQSLAQNNNACTVKYANSET